MFMHDHVDPILLTIVMTQMGLNEWAGQHAHQIAILSNMHGMSWEDVW